MRQELLHGFRLGKMERGLDIHGVEVRQHGEVIAKHQWRKEYRECVFSVSKSFTSMALGFALEEGLVSLVKDPTCEDWLSYIFRQPVVYEPGSHFLYSNVGGYLVSAIIQKKTGQTLRDYLTPRLFKPLHIFNPQWESCPKGINVGASGLYLTTSELSRFGQLLLSGGKFEGKQVVPEAYLKLATSNLVDNNNGTSSDPESNAGYGLQFWRNTVPNSYRADGLYGQYIVVLPDYDAVVTLTSHVEENQNNILRLVWDEILPQLK